MKADPKRLAVRAALARQAALRTAMEHATDEAREKYLAEHDGADPDKHTVKVDRKIKETIEEGEEGAKRRLTRHKSVSNYKKMEGGNATLKGDKALKVLEDKGIELSDNVYDDVEGGTTIAQALQSEVEILAEGGELSDSDAKMFSGALKALGIRIGMEHATQDAKDKYLDEHEGADPANHSVKKVVEKFKETKEKGKKLVDDLFEFADQEKYVQK